MLPSQAARSRSLIKFQLRLQVRHSRTGIHILIYIDPESSMWIKMSLLSPQIYQNVYDFWIKSVNKKKISCCESQSRSWNLSKTVAGAEKNRFGSATLAKNVHLTLTVPGTEQGVGVLGGVVHGIGAQEHTGCMLNCSALMWTTKITSALINI
jgi:hypothetical protein